MKNKIKPRTNGVRAYICRICLYDSIKLFSSRSMGVIKAHIKKEHNKILKEKYDYHTNYVFITVKDEKKIQRVPRQKRGVHKTATIKGKKAKL